MQINIYTTPEITDEMWKMIVDGYQQSFEGHFTTKEKLIDGYTSNSFGFSYHSVCFEGDKIIAFNSIIPYWYYNGNEKIKLGLSGTTFVLKEYRKDIFIFHDMFIALKEYCIGEHIMTFLGVPNKNSHQYFIKLLRSKDICKLSYYALPVKVFNVIGKRKLSIFNLFSVIYSYFLVIINLFLSSFLNFKENLKQYRLYIDDSFLDQRFSNSKYKTIIKNKTRFTYVIADEDGVKAAYIMDFRDKKYRKNSNVLLSAVWHILRKENIDIILYVGTLNMKQLILTKIPRKLERKPLPFIYNVLKVADVDQFKSMSDPENWDFSLINLDVR